MEPVSSFLHERSNASSKASVEVKYSPKGGYCISSDRHMMPRISVILRSPDQICCLLGLFVISISSDLSGIVFSILMSSNQS